ncbi:MAG: hypothetical protein ACTSU9_16510 [Promethearchaeota archaeon]
MSTPKLDSNLNECEERDLKLKCPTCKAQITVTLNTSIKEHGKGGLVNVLVPSSQTKCGHALQFFLDSNFKVRGYTRIDYVNDKECISPKLSYIAENRVPVAVGNAPAQKLEDREESKLSEKERKLKDAISKVIVDFTSRVGDVKAIAVFDYEGYIVAKALNEDLRLEEISLISATMLTQSTMMAGTLKMKNLEDFTITSRDFKVSILKAGELLLLLYYSRVIKPGLMNLYLRGLIDDITKSQFELLK